jgi:5-methylcytosine-specific restriction endonuclease McrA
MDKTCSRCQAVKDVEQFAKNGKLRRHPVCKACRAEIERERRIAEPEKIRAQEAARYRENLEARREGMRRHYEANKAAILAKEHVRAQLKRDEIRIVKTAYRHSNKEKIREWNGTRRAIIKQAMPAWANRMEIAALYKEASRIWEETGIEHHVDHIIPLTHPQVCGLHVPSNLQVLSAKENLSKSNKFSHE